MAGVEMLPLPEGTRASDMTWDAQVYGRDEMHAYARANLAPLQAENERLRAEVETGDTNLAAAMSAVAELEARAERLAEALRKLSADLRTLAGGETPDGDGVPVSVMLWAEKRLAALAQEDRNG